MKKYINNTGSGGVGSDGVSLGISGLSMSAHLLISYFASGYSRGS